MAGRGGSENRTCFVAMPVTTPAPYAEDLRDPDHFGHVLAYLFTPALEQAGYEVIAPKALGATLIHAEIIRHLEQADLVLADLSSHNANVFFELGIRTSLDRPVVLVTDKRTAAIPFDLGTINVLTYDEFLAPWRLEEEIGRLAEHVGSVPADGGSGNAMWKYFGLTQRGGPVEAGSLEEKVDLLLGEVTKLRLAPSPTRKPSWAAVRAMGGPGDLSAEDTEPFFESVLRSLLEREGIGRFEIVPAAGPPGSVDLLIWGPSSPELAGDVMKLGVQLGVPVGSVISQSPFGETPP